jgi:hypothetical protein
MGGWWGGPVTVAALWAASAVVAFGACSAAPEPSTAAGGSSQGGAGGEASGGGGEGGTLPPCDVDPCKLTEPQCGCYPGDKCTLFDDTVGCGPAGDIALGEPCGTCLVGDLCVNNLTGGAPICHRFCDSDAACDEPGGLCVLPVNDGLATVCSQNCDPVTDVGCAVPSMKCDLAREPAGAQRWYTHCTGSGSVGPGGLCANGHQCAKGLGCLGVSGQQDTQCLAWCHVGGDPTCPVDTQCTAFAPSIVVGVLEFGACVSL